MKLFTVSLRSVTSSAGSRSVALRREYSNIPNTAQALVYDSNGVPEKVLKMTSQALPSSLADNQILVKFLAAPINPADLNQIEGTYGLKAKLPAVGGNEGVAVVVAAGSKVKGISVNDHVIPARPGLGTWRTHGVFAAADFQAVPSDIKPDYAATISVNPSTAYRLLEDFVSLKEGDVIIQNGANSAVGYSVLQLANAKKVKTINIIRNKPDHANLVERLKALGGYIVVTDDYLKTPEFKKLVSDLPAPKLALNCIGGDSATEIARNLAEGGTMVTYGGMSRKPVTIPTSLFIFKNIQLRGFWMSKWYEQHSVEERNKMFNTLFEHIRRRELKLWMEDYSFSDYRGAFEKLRSPTRDRKIVFKMD